MPIILIDDGDDQFECNECGHLCDYDDLFVEDVCPICFHDNTTDGAEFE